jgi:hypothetical protein
MKNGDSNVDNCNGHVPRTVQSSCSLEISDCDSQRSSDSGKSSGRTVDEHIPDTSPAKKNVSIDHQSPDIPSVKHTVSVNQRPNSLSDGVKFRTEDELSDNLPTRHDINIDQEIRDSLLKDMSIRCQDTDSDADSLRYLKILFCRDNLSYFATSKPNWNFVANGSRHRSLIQMGLHVRLFFSFYRFCWSQDTGTCFIIVISYSISLNNIFLGEDIFLQTNFEKHRIGSEEWHTVGSLS